MNLSSLEGKLHVLVADTTKCIAESYVSLFELLFKEAGYIAQVDTWASSEIPIDYFVTNYVDVFICDVSLGDSMANKLGLEALDKCRIAHPGIFTIAYSAHGLKYQDVLGRHKFDLFIPKKALSNLANRSHLVESLRRSLKINTVAYISAESETSLSSFAPAELIDLNRVVRKLTFTGSGEPNVSQVSRVDLSEIPGGFSGAIVLRMQSYTKTKFNCVQALLKVALTSCRESWLSLKKEHINYNEYVRWYLPYYWRPELLGVVHEGSLSAICYAFVSARDEQFKTLSASIRENDLASVDIAIESIFRPTFQRWYHPDNVAAESELCNFYLENCFGPDGNSEPQEAAFGKLVNDFNDEGGQFILIGEERFRWPHVALLTPPSPKFYSCIIHGDMNTRNILVSHAHEAKEVTLIDFSATGRGHVYFDFIVFEANLRLDLGLAPNDTLPGLIHRERVINVGDGSHDYLNTTVNKVRDYAFQNFPIEDRNNYLYGLAAYCYGLIGATNLSGSDRRILAACTCAALLDLESRDFWSTVGR